MVNWRFSLYVAVSHRHFTLDQTQLPQHKGEATARKPKHVRGRPHLCSSIRTAQIPRALRSGDPKQDINAPRFSWRNNRLLTSKLAPSCPGPRYTGPSSHAVYFLPKRWITTSSFSSTVREFGMLRMYLLSSSWIKDHCKSEPRVGSNESEWVSRNVRSTPSDRRAERPRYFLGLLRLSRCHVRDTRLRDPRCGRCRS
jgi:hypothetical protein